MPPPDLAHPTSGTIPWTQDAVVGLQMELIDKDRVEWMIFRPAGQLSLTTGEQNGYTMAPTYSWKLVDGRLQIYDPANHDRVYDEWTLISRTPQKIVTRRQSGELATYKVRH